MVQNVLQVKLTVKLVRAISKPARHTHESLRPRWRSETVAVNWMQQLERHAFKRLGALHG